MQKEVQGRAFSGEVLGINSEDVFYPQGEKMLLPSLCGQAFNP